MNIEIKINQIDEYIRQLEDATNEKNSSQIKKLEKEVVSVFYNEIDNLKSGLNAYDPVMSYIGQSIDYISEAKILIAKLSNYKVNLQSGIYKIMKDVSKTNISMTQHVQQEVETEITITFEQTISKVESIPDDVLSAEDKEILNGKLASLSASKDKTTKWDRVKNILGWLVDKGADAAIASLPFVLEMLVK